MARRPVTALFGAALAAGVIAALHGAGHVLGLDVAVLNLAPALLLLLPLLRGRYVGEELVVRLATRHRQRRPRPVRSVAPAGRRPAALLPRGGRVVATWLARRPPPVACA